MAPSAPGNPDAARVLRVGFRPAPGPDSPDHAAHEELTTRLADHYRGQGWPVAVPGDGTVLARGPGGVTWIGTAVVADDIASGDLEARLPALADRRMPAGGELCPLELLPARDCERDVRALLDRLGLSVRRHVAVYSMAG